MERESVVLTLGFLLLVAFPSGEANAFRELWRHLDENYPYVLPTHSVEGETDQQVKAPNFNQAELARIKRFLQKGPPLDENNVIYKVLEGDQIPDLETMEGLDPAIMSRKIQHDSEYVGILTEFYTQYFLEQFAYQHEANAYAAESHSRKNKKAGEDGGHGPHASPRDVGDSNDDPGQPADDPVQLDDDPDDPQDRDQVGGYEGCRRDYDTLVAPVMASVLHSIIEAIPWCEILLEATNITGEMLDQLDVCDCEEVPAVGSTPRPDVWECTTNLELPLSETFCEDLLARNASGQIIDLLPMCECDTENIGGPPGPPIFVSNCTTIPTDLVETEPWAARMIDALAKVPTGLADGKLHWVGGFEMCESVDARYTWVETRSLPPDPDLEEEPRHVKGRYCRMHVGLGADTLANLSSVSGVPIGIGLCVPDTCEEEDVTRYITQENLLFMAVGYILNTNITAVYCKLPSDTSGDWVYWGVMFSGTIIFILILIATIYDLCGRKKFTINHYGPQLLKVHKTKEVRRKAAVAASKSQGDLPSGYMHVHPEEHRKYSVTTLGISEADLTKLRKTYSRQTSGKGTSMLKMIPKRTIETQVDPTKLTAFERFELAMVGWSAYTNIHRLMDTSSPPHHIPVFDGVRVMSFGWAVLGGMYVWGPLYNDCFLTANMFRALRELPANWAFQPVLNFGFSSDSFLVISGAMITYWWLRRFEAKGKKLDTWLIVHYILHRYWRLMPAYMLLLFLYTGTYQYPGGTPFFTTSNADGDNCKENWWTNLLFVMNLVKTDAQCLGWSWQLSLLFQLHVVTLVVLIPMAIKPIAGYIMLGAMYLASLGAAAGVSANVYGGTRWDDWYKEYMQTPWCRAGPFCVGLVLGIILHNYKKIKLHWIVVLCGWVVAFVCIIVPVYSTYGQFKDGGELWGKEATVWYDALARTAFGLGLAWLIFACHYGYGSIINTLLCLKLWQPMSKLTFSAWLVHVLMAYVWAYGRYTLFYFSTINMAWLFLGQVWVAYVFGALLYLFYHATFSCAIERCITCQSRMHALLSGRYPGDYFDQFHEAQRVQVSEVDNTEKEEALKQAGYGDGELQAAWKGWGGPPPAYDQTGQLTRSQSEPGVTLQRSTSWQY